MNNNNPYASSPSASYSGTGVLSAERTTFIRKTYTHLFAAIIAFIGLEAMLMQTISKESLFGLFSAGGRLTPFLILGAFMVVSWVARSWAESSQSLPLQYAGLSLYVVAEAVIFLPLMFYSMAIDPVIPFQAGLITLMIFAGLTAYMLINQPDLASWGRYLWMAGMGAFAVAILGMVFGFSLGLLFCAAMVILLSGYILYDTSNVVHHFGTQQYVAASLALFSSVATLFWYVLRISSILRDE